VSGFAVIDLETTGFAYNRNDRVCEIAVVLVDPAGRVEHRYSTLVNPGRDLGAQHVHHIDATDARVAPTFDLIVGDVTELLAGRVLVAHNSAFDTSFLVAEYGRAGWPLDLTHEQTLCTMRMASSHGLPPKLSSCCEAFGIPLTDAHAALADAEATAALLGAYMTRAAEHAMWREWQDFAETLTWPSPPRLATATVGRGTTSTGRSALADLAMNFVAVGEPPVGNEYLDLLGRVLADRKISADERRALGELASLLGLSAADQARLHRHYMVGIVDAALDDAHLSHDERALIIQLAQLLELSNLETEALLARANEMADSVDVGLQLSPGDLVVLTGMTEARKRELTVIAQARGLVVWPGVKKGVKAVIAQDPGSESGKARKAREYGIPVVDEGVLTN